ncbi:MAG: lipase family protein [Planctomycetaceae bacterium]
MNAEVGASPANETPEPAYDVAALQSVLAGPISKLSLLRQSLLFAEIADVAYYDEDVVARLVEPLGLHLTMEFFDRDGAQAYRLESDTDAVIVCRGTEPDETNDMKADIDAAKVAAETVGHVHRGFRREVDDLWPMIEKSIKANKTKTVWFCGHSLGGAMATICAGRCYVSEISSMPESLFTYGSPRVGTKRYINHCNIKHIRWVNNNDIVPRLPPAMFGFRHAGREMYLDRNGRLRDLDYWGKAGDRFRGFFRTLTRFRIDWLSDHLMSAYIAAIAGVVQRAEAAGHPDALPPE